jgi:hypothetical protein
MTMTLMGKIKRFLMVGVIAVTAMAGGDSASGQANSCGMILNDTPAIFCETFDQPFPITNRSGQLDGTLWGVSRAGGGIEWNTSTLDTCNGPVNVNPPNDVIVCNGQMRQSLEDGGGVYVLAAYPKQPFDWANRTGTVAFDVTNDTSGSHGTWPEFWISNLPVPAPFVHSTQCDFCSVPQHAIGIRFAASNGDCGTGSWRADSVIAVRDYVEEDRGIFDGNTTGMQIQQTGCVTMSSGPNGGLNHIEIRISQNNIDVYATDAGTRAPLKHINTITNANLSFSRGLIWIEDAHYNAHKSDRDESHNHTYAWDNVAFDGPATYRDLSFDVLDRVAPPPAYPSTINLGWETAPGSPANLNTLPMTAANISAATRALLMFNFGTYPHVNTFNYSINGHAVSVANPIPLPLNGKRSVSFEVPLAWLVPGPQNIVISGDEPFGIHNVNIVLVAAAPVPGIGPPAVPSTPSGLRILASP